MASEAGHNCTASVDIVSQTIERSNFAMERCHIVLQRKTPFHPAPRRNWFQFDGYDYCYFPYLPDDVCRDLLPECFFYRRPSAEEHAENTENACWHSFSNDRKFRLSINRMPLFNYCGFRTYNAIGARLSVETTCTSVSTNSMIRMSNDVYFGNVSFVESLDVDDVYFGEDFIMIQLGYLQCRLMGFEDMSYRWMVVWIHHEDGRCLRYGQVLRRPTLADFRGTSRANWRPQPWLSSVINLAKSYSS